jgi:hypothetical protein
MITTYWHIYKYDQNDINYLRSLDVTFSMTGQELIPVQHYGGTDYVIGKPGMLEVSTDKDNINTIIRLRFGNNAYIVGEYEGF